MKKKLTSLLSLPLITLSLLLVNCSAPPPLTGEDCCEECEGDHNAWSPISSPIKFDQKKKSYRGTLVVGKRFDDGPVMQTFEPDGAGQLFWIDSSQSKEVQSYFERITRNDKINGVPYKPRRITLNGYFQPSPDSGPASKCDGVFIAKGMY